MANELVAGNRRRDNLRLFTRLSVIAVAMNPGATQLAVTPRRAYSLAIDLNMPIMPALAAV